MSDIVMTEPAAGRAQRRRPPRRSARYRRLRASLAPLPWIGPAIVLIALVVIWPVVVMIQTSFQNVSAQTIPGELYEAARVDGAAPWQSYRRITLPLLRPAFLIGVVINLMNVFNSFPIIWEMTNGGPGYQTSTSTSTIFMYDLKNTFVGQSAAMSIINFVVVVIVAAFIRLNRRTLQEAR